ncbi:hypothetical protein [Gordonia shandongensis]|uniref:hypothetical protein n=1 Tax=Gordonia shandongensis TaxID=376351 RepID=UPI000424694B|nr:hypothetical protein [Gordonia shandongensis]
MTSLLLPLASCSSDAGTEASDSRPSTTSDSASSSRPKITCSRSFADTSDCTRIARVDIDGSGDEAEVGLVFDKPSKVRVTLPGDRTDEIEIASNEVGGAKAVAGSARKMQFYELDGQPGTEIIVPIETEKSGTYFQVFSWRDGELVRLPPPGFLHDPEVGEDHWTFSLAISMDRRVLCRDGGISLESNQYTSLDGADVTDYAFSDDGSDGSWAQVGKTRSGESPSPRTSGTPYFYCEDLRTRALFR